MQQQAARPIAHTMTERVRITLEPVARPASVVAAPARVPGQRPATSPMVRPQPQQRLDVTPLGDRSPADWIDAYIQREEVVRLPVSVVIATLNDAPTIGHVLARLTAVQQLVVVDSGSTDDTVEVVRSLRPDAIVVAHRHTSAGSAVLAGIAETSAHYLVCVAADDDLDIAEIHRAIAMIDHDRGIVAGTRRQVGDDRSGPKPPFGGQGRALAGFCNLLLGTSLTDPPFGYVAMSRDKAAELGLGVAAERSSKPLVAQVSDPEGDRRRAEYRWKRGR